MNCLSRELSLAAFRSSFDCLPIIFRLPSDHLPIAFRSSSDRLPAAFSSSSDCLLIVFQLSSDYLPTAFRPSSGNDEGDGFVEYSDVEGEVPVEQSSVEVDGGVLCAEDFDVLGPVGSYDFVVEDSSLYEHP